MILFLGDSFTWGQGLQYYPLVEKKGWSWEDCNNFYERNMRYEWLGFEEDEFRKQNSFPYLVAKEMDLPYQTPRYENGGDNFQFFKILENIDHSFSKNNIFLLVVQFTQPVRSILHGEEPKFDTMDEQIEWQVKRIADWATRVANIDWLGLSWQWEIGDVLKEQYPTNYVPILHENREYSCFCKMSHQELSVTTLSEETNFKVLDDHLGIRGHKIVANSILKKIYSRPDLLDKYNKLKEQLR